MARDWLWLNRLRGGTAKAVEAAANFITASLWNISDTGPVIDQENYAQAYQINVWVNACIEAICNDAAAVPYGLFKNGEPVEQHPLLDLLKRVNDDDDWAGLVWATAGYRRLTGDAYWLLAGTNGPGSKPYAIFPLRPDRVEIKATNIGIQSYVYNRTKGDRRGEKRFEPHEIIHFRRWNPLNDLYGQSVIQAAETSINLDNKVRRFNYEFLRRGAVPSGMLSAQGDMAPEQAEQVKAKWRELYSGEAKAGETMVYGSNLTYQELGKSARDGQYIELAKMAREEIIAAFHVPPIRVGILDHASYASADEEEEIYWKSCIVPEVKYLFGRMNEKLVPRYGDNLELRPDFSDVEALQEGKTERASRLQPAVGAPYLTINEVRAEDGREPIGDDGDTILQPLNMVPLGALPQPEATQQEPTPPKATTPWQVKQTPPENKGRFGEFGSAQHVEYWKAFDRSLLALEERFRKTMAALYTEALDEVLAALAEEADKHLKATVPTPDSILREIFTDAQAERWVAGIMPHVTEGLELGGQRALTDIGGGAWNIERPEVVQWLGEKKLKIVTLPETMFDNLRAVLQEAVNEGVGVPEMASRIRDLQPGYERYKADRVARTETVGANNKGSLEGYRQNDIEKKEWLTALDEKVRGLNPQDKFNHAAANGQVRPIDKPFAVSGQALDHPGDQRGSAGNVVNCRCVLLPVV